MARFSLEGSPTFPAGTVVGAYLRASWPHPEAEGGPPTGAVLADTATVANDTVGMATFTDLAYATRYFAAAEVAGAWKKVGFATVPEPSTPELIEEALASTVHGAGIAAAAAGKIAVANGDGSWSAQDGPVLNVRMPPWNAKGDGVTDDSAAVLAALTALPSTGGEVFFPRGTYLVNNIVMPQRQAMVLRGAGARLLKGADGPMFTTPGSGWGNNTRFLGLDLLGNGGVFTGPGIVVGASSGWLTFRGGSILFTEDACIDFATPGGGSEASITNTVLHPINSASGEANEDMPAVRLPNDGASPANRGLVDVRTAGAILLEDHGSQDTRVGMCEARTLALVDDPKKLIVMGCRMATVGEALVLNGQQCVFSGLVVAGDIVAGALIGSAITSCIGAADMVLGDDSQEVIVTGCHVEGTVSDTGTDNKIWPAP